MIKARVHRRFERGDGVRVDVCENPSGQFRFVEERWIDTSDETGVAGDGFWSPRYTSGLYESAATAESEAIVTIAWLSEGGEA